MTTLPRKERPNDNNNIMTVQTGDGRILFIDRNNNNSVKSQSQESREMVEHIHSQGPLRRSLFGGIPPFINYVPAGGFTGKTEKGPQYWDENKVIAC